MPRNTPWQNIVRYLDDAPNDSDKTLTVPAEKQWLIRSLYAKLISTATVGNRTLYLLVTDPTDNPLFKYYGGATQAAGLTREYVFAPQHPQETAFTNGVILRAIAEGIALPSGYKIRVYDSAAIDAAADDLTVVLLVEERSE